MQEIFLLEVCVHGATSTTIEGAFWSLKNAKAEAERRAREHYHKAENQGSAKAFNIGIPITMAADPSPIFHLTEVVEDWDNDPTWGRTTYYIVRKVKILEAPLVALAAQAE